MQTEIPALPVVQLHANTNFDRNQNSNLNRSMVEVKVSSLHKSIAYFPTTKKTFYPLIGQPYQSSIRQKTSLDHSKHKKNSIKQRVLSAKMLRIKELQNQLADAHYQLNELANENRLLKSLQKRQDSALKRYEGTNAELPRIINSHHEELRVLQIKYKKLKALHKETCSLLKDRENEYQQLQSQNKHLLQLSKDRNLGEREKLQSQISDLNYRIEQQQDTIQTLHRKISLETKSLKQQLYAEISKRKETQKHLEETTQKLKSLEHLLDNRERKLYSNGQLVFPTKNRRLSTQFLTNVRDVSSSNPQKLADQHKKWQNDVQEHSLPALNSSDVSDQNNEIDERVDSNQTSSSMKTETMANLEQIRKYRLQKSAHRKTSSDDFNEKLEEFNFTRNKDSKASIHSSNSERLEEHDESDENQYEVSAHVFRKAYENRKCKNLMKFNELLKTEVDNLSESGESGGENEDDKDSQIHVTVSPKESRIRLSNNSDEAVDTKEFILSNNKFGDKLGVLVQERDDIDKSDSEAETERRRESIEHYVSSNYPNSALKLISSAQNDQIHYGSNPEYEDLSISHFLNESQKMYQNLVNEIGAQTRNVENEYLSELYDNMHINNENVVTSYSTNKSSEDSQKHIVEQPEFQQVEREENSDDTCKGKNEFQNDLLMQMISVKNNKLKIPFNPDLASYTTETLSNEQQNRLLATNSSDAAINLDKDQKSDVTYEKTIETRNKINKQEVNEELKDIDISLSNMQSLKLDSIHNTPNEVDVNSINESSARMKTISYNKEKLLATMKAIDDNENIEYLNQDYEKDNVTSRKQITENLFRGLPTHMKKNKIL